QRRRENPPCSGVPDASCGGARLDTPFARGRSARRLHGPESMRTSGLCLMGVGAMLAWAGCGGSTECGPGTFESDGVCVVESPGGHDDAEDWATTIPAPRTSGIR